MLNKNLYCIFNNFVLNFKNMYNNLDIFTNIKEKNIKEKKCFKRKEKIC